MKAAGHHPVRGFAATFTFSVAIALSAVTLSRAQERIEFVTYAYPGSGTVFEELDVSVSRFGDVRHVTKIPDFDGFSWVSLAGGRYLVARGGTRDQPRALAVFDRRTRSVPGIVPIPIFPSQIVADPLRPRVFVGNASSIGVVDAATLSYREIISGIIFSTFVYAPRAGLLFSVDHDPLADPPGPYVAVRDVESGALLRRFLVDMVIRQIAVDLAGRHFYVLGNFGTSLPFDSPGIGIYDALTGEVTARTDVDADEFVLDERRDWLLADLKSTARLAVFHAKTLAPLYTKTINPPPFSEPGIVRDVTLVPGRWLTGAYIFRTILKGPIGGDGCVAIEVEALDADGTTRAVADALTPLGARPNCNGFVVLVRSPFAPDALTADVTGNRITLTWEEPGDASEYVIEVGLSPGATALVQRVGLTNAVSVDNVPSGVYYVRVRAVNEIGPGPVSNEVRVMVP